MIDDALQQLNTLALDHSLDSLESDIWMGLTVRARHRDVTRRRVSFQGAIMGLSLIVSVAIGIHATRVAGTHGPLLLTSGLELAPSSLLLSNAR